MCKLDTGECAGSFFKAVQRLSIHSFHAQLYSGCARYDIALYILSVAAAAFVLSALVCLLSCMYSDAEQLVSCCHATHAASCFSSATS
jgi:hypothetical protein